MRAEFSVGDVVYRDGHRMKIVEGPFSTLDYPHIDQYVVLGSSYGKTSAWASDLISEADYIEATAEEGCRE